MYRTVRVAALSIKPRKWDKPFNADKLEAYVREAAREGPELIVTPEGFLEGYVVMVSSPGARVRCEPVPWLRRARGA